VSRPGASPLVAAGLAALSLVALVRSSLAEPPPMMEPRPVAEVLAALEASKADAATMASVRWYVEVTRGAVLQAPVGSPKSTLGPWGENGALQAAEDDLRDCTPLAIPEAQAAIALHKEYKDALPPMLRGVALAHQGKLDDAAALYRATALASLPGNSCPSEHPMYSHRRIGRLQRLLSCLERWQPKANHAPVKKVLERARACAARNNSVG